MWVEKYSAELSVEHDRLAGEVMLPNEEWSYRRAGGRRWSGEPSRPLSGNPILLWKPMPAGTRLCRYEALVSYSHLMVTKLSFEPCLR